MTQAGDANSDDLLLLFPQETNEAQETNQEPIIPEPSLAEPRLLVFYDASPSLTPSSETRTPHPETGIPPVDRTEAIGIAPREKCPERRRFVRDVRTRGTRFLRRRDTTGYNTIDRWHRDARACVDGKSRCAGRLPHPGSPIILAKERFAAGERVEQGSGTGHERVADRFHRRDSLGGARHVVVQCVGAAAGDHGRRARRHR